MFNWLFIWGDIKNHFVVGLWYINAATEKVKSNIKSTCTGTCLKHLETFKALDITYFNLQCRQTSCITVNQTQVLVLLITSLLSYDSQAEQCSKSAIMVSDSQTYINDRNANMTKLYMSFHHQ